MQFRQPGAQYAHFELGQQPQFGQQGNLVFSSPPPIPASIEIANPYLVALPYDVGTPAKAKEASPPPPPKEEEEGTWLQVSENAYGAFIVEAMFNGIGSAIVSTLPILAASVLAQACFALYIYGIARDFCPSSDYGAADVWDCLAEISLQNKNNMCDTCGAPIQFVALMVYLVMLFNNVAGMYTHLEIVFNSHDHKYDEKMELDYDGDADPVDLGFPERCLVFVLAVASEMVVWVAMLISGILFVFQSTSNEEVIRSTVAITFILSIDELLYGACSSARRKSTFKRREFKIPARKALYKGLELWSIYGQLWFLLALSFVIVASMRRECSNPGTDRKWNFNWNTKGWSWDSLPN